MLETSKAVFRQFASNLAEEREVNVAPQELVFAVAAEIGSGAATNSVVGSAPTNVYSC